MKVNSIKPLFSVFLTTIIIMLIKPAVASQWSSSPLEVPFPYASEWNLSVRTVSDGKDGMIVARLGFAYQGGYRYTLECQRISSQGDPLWGNGVVIDSPFYSYYPYLSIGGIISDGTGGAIIIIQGSTNNSVYKIDSNGVKVWGPIPFVPQWVWRMSESYAYASDGSGGVILTWMEGNFDTVISRIDSTGKEVWKKTLLLGRQPSGYVSQEGPVVCNDGRGGVIVVWWDYTNFPFSLRAQYIDYNGNYLWGEKGIVLSNEESSMPEISLVTDGVGGTFISWKDYLGYLNVYHANINGELLFETKFNFSIYFNNKIVSDRAGGVFLLWTGFSNWSPYNLYMQHISYNGDLLLGPDGQKVIDGTFWLAKGEVLNVKNGVIVRPGEHMVIPGREIFKIGSNGNLEWQKEIFNNLDDDVDPDYVNDNPDSLIMVWSAYDSNNKAHVFAQRISSDGIVGDIAVKAPTNLIANDAGCDYGGSITLTWNLSADDGAGINKITGYNVYRSISTNGTFEFIGRVVNGINTYVDNSATIENEYYYIVRATDGVKESADSNIAIGASARNLPLPPTTATAVDTPYDLGGSITLAWTKSVDDGAGLNNVAGYNVYRYSLMGGDHIKIGVVPAGGTVFTDNSTIDNTTYIYSIRSVAATCNGIESAPSDESSAQSVNNLTALPQVMGSLPGIMPELVNSLESKVNNAILALDRGNKTAAIYILNALLQEIAAQSGNKIDPSTAELLTVYIESLINYINTH